MVYMRNGTQIGMRRMTNTIKSSKTAGLEKKIIDLEMMELLSTD